MANEHFFYISPESIVQNRFTLDLTESHHAVHVMRLKNNDLIWLLNGEGVAYIATILNTEPVVSGLIEEIIPNYAETKVKMHLAAGLLKKERFELLLEKAVECGAQSITPLLLDRCVKKTLNMTRSTKIVTSAAKQCGRSFFPALDNPVHLEDWLKNNHSEAICLNIGSEEKLWEWNRKNQPETIHVIIGPEGDFSENEKKLMTDYHVPFVSFGYRRLRAETAAITALNIIEHGR